MSWVGHRAVIWAAGWGWPGSPRTAPQGLHRLGAPPGRGVGARWEGIDLEGRRLHMAHGLQRIAGKLQLEPLKTKSSRRTIVMPAATVDALRQHRARQLDERLFAGDRWTDTCHVFTTNIGTPLACNKVLKGFRRLLVKADLPRIPLHDLPHSLASRLPAPGVPMRAVMDTLGHSQISLTMDSYSHVMPVLQGEVAAAMDQVLEQ